LSAWTMTEGIRSGETTVLVIDAETRHVSPDQAYRKVFAVAKDAREAGIPYIYKKTDSALRGNIGSELEAAYRAAGEPFLSFVPALPQMRRQTVYRRSAGQQERVWPGSL
jgi:uncharacterized protein YgbK (DUF1537 family)